ncbi:MAG: cation:proton antiporter [Clostridiales bacterium]|nr:cation:proton antiporter [Clostridiales bacterium]
MVIGLLRIIAIVCVAAACGKMVSKVKLPSILGWLIAGIIFGPYLAGVVTLDITNALWYKAAIKLFECFAGVMIGREIIFKKIASSGKQIIGITFVQSIGTFLVVFLIADIPVYPAFVFGGIALATAPAPALSIVNEYHTSGPVTKTLIPLAAIDDIIGVIVFFTVISIVSGTSGSAAASPLAIAGMVLFPFAIGIFTGVCAAFLLKRSKNNTMRLALLVVFLCVSVVCGLLIDKYLFYAFRLNYLLIGLAFSATVANIVPEKELTETLKLYSPLLNLSLVIVIVNLGMPLDYRLIAGAGLFTAIYILSRAAGKIGGAFLGGKLTKAEPAVTKYLGFTLLPHSGVSLVFTGIAVTTLTSVDSSLAAIVSGTIVAAAIINEIIAVIVAKFAFKLAGEIKE